MKMNVARPFREGKGLTMIIWVDQILKKETRQVVDWDEVDKDKYLSTMIMKPFLKGLMPVITMKDILSLKLEICKSPVINPERCL